MTQVSVETLKIRNENFMFIFINFFLIKNIIYNVYSLAETSGVVGLNIVNDDGLSLSSSA